MKKIYFITTILLILIGVSCEDTFDKKPLNKISESIVFENEDMVRAYVTDLYGRISFNAFNHYKWYTFCDEGTFAPGNGLYTGIPIGNLSRDYDEEGYWNYNYIRDMNVFLEKINEAPIFEELKLQLEGEVRAMRALAYFEMQKRYGGVPLVDIVLDPFDEISEQYTKRSKEEEIADFIDSEFEKAISLLPENPEPKGQINKWTAYALKARANLWSASIAKYGTVQLDGVVGIPIERADEFFEKASTAADSVINSGNYALYNELSDKSENYRILFLDEGNEEVIFEEVYNGVEKGHSFDQFCVPPTFSEGRGGSANPTLDFLLGYENIDGSTVQPQFGPENLYENGFAPFQNKDPRLYATVFFQGDQWAGGTVQTYEGMDIATNPNPTTIISSPNDDYQGIPTIGNDSRLRVGDDKSTNSGFILKKYIMNEANIGQNKSTTNWIFLRLAEMYLTKAEAAFELGEIDDAIDALNETRERAGISLVDQNTISMDKIRTERRSELAFEVHRWWDLKRWRIAEEVLNNSRLEGLQIIYHIKTDNYYFIPFPCEDFSRTFRPQHYYHPITDARIDNNPDLIENPLY